MIEIQHCLHNLSNPNIKSRLTSFNTFLIQNYILNIYFFHIILDMDQEN